MNLGSAWHIPELLMRPSAGGLLRWQWLASPCVVLAAVLIALALGRLSRRVLKSLVRRTPTPWDDAVVDRLGPPIVLAWTVAILFLFASWLELPERGDAAVSRVLNVTLVATVFWAVARTLEVSGQVLAAAPWAKTHAASAALIPLGTRIGKVALLVMAVIAVLSGLGYPVASLLAGLGIGGLAFALASQKTVENLFGAVSIGADQPFREGDVVRVEDITGTVEAIGLRSTRIRTLDRTLVSLPNGKLAEMRIENHSMRDRTRLACTLGLVYGTSAAQVREVVGEIERALRENAKVWPDSIQVRLTGLGASSLDVEVSGWFKTTDWNEFSSLRQEALLTFLDVVERAGTSLAFPTHTVHLAPAGAEAAVGPLPRSESSAPAAASSASAAVTTTAPTNV